jgi:hypothetical protein
MTVSVRINQTVWLSKYALTAGIQSVKVRRRYERSDGSTAVTITGYSQYLRLGHDVHLTRELAVERAEVMQVAKIEKLVF